ncbi:MAG TPA: GlsB/YeaQ/YmgE family stress response membrane protein [Candidatus Sulfotelmatobacter sp.]|nr:GlsB/YeaQ/YmgE family stress response membrane protein [Candidatus Sulfotelmatobacter sp.]
MEGHDLISWIVIGLIAGWLAGRLVQGRGMGCLVDIVVGIAGAVIGGVLISRLAPDLHYGFVGSVVVAFIGASLFLAVLRLLGVGRGAPLRRWR